MPAVAQELRIVAGTSLIEDIARDLAPPGSEILTLVQGSACPGHDHGKTKDFLFAARADIILVHGFQRRMPQLAGMMEAIGDKRPPLTVVEVNGSWLVPENQKKAVLAVAEALKAACPAQAAAIEARAAQRLQRVEQAAAQSAALLAPVREKPVICAQMQAEFVQWAGLRVVHTYGRAEDVSAREMALLVEKARKAGVRGVVDNTQSGPEAGLPLALELNVSHITLSNFPGSDAAVPDYFTLLRANAAALARL